MSNMTETTTITLELTTEQVEFLEWAAKLEGITPEQYLLRVAEESCSRRRNTTNRNARFYPCA